MTDMDLILEMAEVRGRLAVGPTPAGGLFAPSINTAPKPMDFPLTADHPILGPILTAICSAQVTYGRSHELYRQLFREMKLIELQSATDA